MYFLAGLGNPGKQYEKTRHNVGFDAIEALASQGSFAPFKEFKKSLVAKGHLGRHPALLIMPQTFMNLSGDSVAPILKFYKAEVENLIVIHDELDFDPGVLRIKKGGGHGGHNGLRSLMQHLGPEFLRLRIGVGKPTHRDAGKNHVLTRFSGDDRISVEQSLDRCTAAVEMILDEGVAKAMGEFNQSK